MPKPLGTRSGRARAAPLAPWELVEGEKRKRKKEFLERRTRGKGAGDADTGD